MASLTPFIIYALPRSRTFWLSRYLSYGAWHCGHDELRHMRSLDDVKSWLSQPNTGTVETLAAPWWRLAREVRTIVVRRPVADVVASLARLGFDPTIMLPIMTKLDRKLDQIEARVPDVLSVDFAALATDEGCSRIFEHCLPYQHDPEWFALMEPMNLQINMASLVRYTRAYLPQMEKLGAIAKRQTITSMGPRKVVSKEDVTIQQETSEVWFRDGKRLFEEHSIQLGEAPDGYLRRNWKLMHSMDQNGFMQITTARCNGRMVGYYVCYVAPATDDLDLVTSTHISIFVSKDFAGLGTRLQRASLDALRERGVGEVCFRAGINGDGARMGAIYKRAGAEHIGQMYRLSLRGP